MCLAKGTLGLLSWAFLPRHSGCCHFRYETKKTCKHGVQLIGWWLLCMRAGNQGGTDLSSSILVVNSRINGVFRMFREWSLRWGQGSLGSKEQLVLGAGLRSTRVWDRRIGEAHGGPSMGGVRCKGRGRTRFLQPAGGSLIVPVRDLSHRARTTS